MGNVRLSKLPLNVVNWTIHSCAHKSGVERGTGVFISALSADETSPALAATCHAITALFSCRFKCLCPPRQQPHFHGNADRAHNTLHFASKVVFQGASPFGKPRQQNRLNTSHFPALDVQPLFVVSSPRFVVCV